MYVYTHIDIWQAVHEAEDPLCSACCASEVCHDIYQALVSPIDHVPVQLQDGTKLSKLTREKSNGEIGAKRWSKGRCK